MKPTFFETPRDFRAWLDKNHDKAPELWVGFHKVGTGKASITWPESVDQALCFGWIDGIRKSIDGGSYMIRFTPRRPKSRWSAVNVKRAGELAAQGLMMPAGLAAFEARDPTKTPYSYEARTGQFDPAIEKRFQAHRQAWKFFTAQPPYYRKTLAYWVMSAKQEETRLRRLERLIQASADGKRVQ
jgi:uncharacterized protein YdeI (YjbR/CyaY-like superfamily)